MLKQSAHSEACYVDLGTHATLVRVARHPATGLAAACGNDQPDVDIVVGRPEEWDLVGKRRSGPYFAPTDWMPTWSAAAFRRVLASALRRVRKSRRR